MIDLDRAETELLLKLVSAELDRLEDLRRRSGASPLYCPGGERDDSVAELVPLDDLWTKLDQAIIDDQARLEKSGPRVHHVRPGESLRDVLDGIDLHPATHVLVQVK